jgi:hypothetical protein
MCLALHKQSLSVSLGTLRRLQCSGWMVNTGLAGVCDYYRDFDWSIIHFTHMYFIQFCE